MITRTKLLEFVRLLGLDPYDVAEMTWTGQEITATVYERNEYDSHFLREGEIALKTVRIPVVEEPT